MMLPLPPSLSEDSLRYLWDGKVLASGYNPYRLAPEAEELESLRDARWRQLPHRDVPTVYPPLALATFSIAAASPAPYPTWKAILAAADLFGCLLLLRIAGVLGLDPRRVAWYAWNPLVTLEIAGMGHVEGLGVPLTIAAVWWLVRKPPRRLSAAMAAAGAVLAKLVPVLALPLWSRRSGRPWLFLGVAGAVVVAVFLPVVQATGGVPPGLIEYGVSWEFNGPLYEPLWRALDGLGAPEAIKGGLDRLKIRTGEHDFWNLFYPYVYGRLLAKLLLAAGLGVVALVALRDRRPVPATGVVFGAMVLASATVYPWYVLWVLPWAALCLHPAWLLLAALVPLSYLPQLTAVPLVPWIFLAIWLPVLLTLLARPRWSTD